MSNILRRISVLLIILLLVGCCPKLKEGEYMATATINISADALINNNQPTTNFGSYLYLFVGQATTITNAYYRSVLTADLSSIPSSATITAATFYMYQHGDTDNTATLTFDIYRTTSAWAEGTVTWNTQPTLAASPAVTGLTCPQSASGEWRSWNVLALINELRTNSASSFMLKSQDETLDYSIKTFRSKDYSGTDYDPYITITYTATAFIAPTAGSIANVLTPKYIAIAQGSIDKEIAGMKVAPVQGSIDKTIF